MNNQSLEIFGILVIVGLQVLIFIKTYNKIKLFESIFPKSDSFSIIKPSLRKDFFSLHPKEILDNLNEKIEESKPQIILPELTDDAGYVIREASYEFDDRITTDLISCEKDKNEITDRIVYSLNTYLIRNRGIASDFHLIKDIVERNCERIENDINQSISLPLYLGLLGTFLGIIFGLFQISGVDFASDPKALDNAISLLLNGVKIAMIASFFGLALTILNSGYFFKRGKALIEDNKNEFYTFIQVDLLPLLNQNINSTLYSLQNNLHKFNEDFKTNVSKLSGVMGKNHEALIAQEKILTTLEKMDITEFGKANVKILRELQISTDKFVEFNKYFGAINEMINSSRLHAEKVNEMIERTDNFNILGQKIIGVFEENKSLIEFLQNHYNSLDQSHQLITQAVNGVGRTLDETLENLKTFTQERINEVQKITLREIDLMQNEYPEKWKKLDNLSFLESVNKNLNEIKNNSISQINGLSAEMKSINDKLLKANTELSTIKDNSGNTLFSKATSLYNKIISKN